MPSVNLSPDILKMQAVKTITATNVLATRPLFLGASWNIARGGDQRIAGRRPVVLASGRAIGSQTDDVFTIRGFDIPEQTNDTYVQVFKQTGTLGSETNTDFQTTFAYAALATTAATYHNWVVKASIFKITQTAASTSVTAGSTALSATGGKFTEELWPGDTIQVGNDVNTIVSITSDTAAVCENAFTATTSTGTLYQLNRVLTGTANYCAQPSLVPSSASDFSVSNVSSQLKVVLATATDLPSGAELVVYNTASLQREILASGLHVNEHATVQLADVVWAACTGGTSNEFSEAGVNLLPIGVI